MIFFVFFCCQSFLFSVFLFDHCTLSLCREGFFSFLFTPFRRLFILAGVVFWLDVVCLVWTHCENWYFGVVVFCCFYFWIFSLFGFWVFLLVSLFVWCSFLGGVGFFPLHGGGLGFFHFLSGVFFGRGVVRVCFGGDVVGG